MSGRQGRFYRSGQSEVRSALQTIYVVTQTFAIWNRLRECFSDVSPRANDFAMENRKPSVISLGPRAPGICDGRQFVRVRTTFSLRLLRDRGRGYPIRP